MFLNCYLIEKNCGAQKLLWSLYLSLHIELHLPWLIAIGLLLQKTFAKLICAQAKGRPLSPSLSPAQQSSCRNLNP